MRERDEGWGPHPAEGHISGAPGGADIPLAAEAGLLWVGGPIVEGGIVSAEQGTSYPFHFFGSEAVEG